MSVSKTLELSIKLSEKSEEVLKLRISEDNKSFISIEVNTPKMRLSIAELKEAIAILESQF